MKIIKNLGKSILLFAMVILFIESCREEDKPTPLVGEGIFWTSSQTLGGSFIDIKIENEAVGRITKFSATAPSCGTSGYVTIKKTPGTYKWTGIGEDQTTWNGTIIITANQCMKMELVDNSSGGSGGGTGGGSGGGTGGGSGGGTGGGGSLANGQVLFWIQSDLGCGNINVTVGGQTKSITGFYSEGAPACGASSAATFTLSPGIYNYTASCTGKTWSGSVTVTDSGCAKMQLTTSSSGGGNSATGQALFWIQSDFGCGSINVTMGGQTKSITGFFAGGAPSCGASGAATFSLAPGAYNYSASCTGKTWNGTVTILDGGCFKLQLTNNSGGGGGGSAATGQAMFWTQSDLGCGSINVTVNGQTKAITGYYSSGAPSCGASSAATFILVPGTYNYSATCTGKTWNGTITATEGGCSRLQLTGTSGGSGGGGTGTNTCQSANSFVSATAVFKNICGNTNDVSVTVKNNSNQRLAIRIALERTSGAWDCGIVQLNSGATGTYWICKGTGKYRISSMLDSEWISKCTFGACP